MTPCASRGGTFRGVNSRVRNTIGWMRGLDRVRVDVLLAVVFLALFEVQALVRRIRSALRRR